MVYTLNNNILDLSLNPCTGCGACAIVCPLNCIELRDNENGFLSPFIDNDICSHCGFCKEVCFKFLDFSSEVQSLSYRENRVLAVINNYFDQMQSVTSAGVANRLASVCLDRGYSVCGVVFDGHRDECNHVVVSDQSQLNDLKGSKYIQSHTVNAFRAIMSNSIPSIVFGTPCQIYGFRRNIQNMHINNGYILVDLFCRGIPSRHLWVTYKSYIQRHFNLDTIKYVNFRDKAYGWHKFGMRIIDTHGAEYFQTVYNDLFYYFYLGNLALSPACYKCPFRHHLSYADMRLGDFWGPKYRTFDDGVGLVVLLSDKGKEAWSWVEPMLRYEECLTKDIFESQRLDEILIPNDYEVTLSSLARGDNLEEIFVKLKQDKRP